MMNEYIEVWNSSFKLKDSLSRKNYWSFVCVNFLCLVIILKAYSLFMMFQLFPLLFLLSFSAGIRRMNDIKKPWFYLFIPFYNLYLLGQNPESFAPLKSNAHLNLKSFGIACVLTLLVLTDTFSKEEGGGFINIEAVIGVALIALVFLLCCFIIVRLIAYFIVKEKLYPNIIFQILIPFFFILNASFIIYGIYFIKPFGEIEDFKRTIKSFITEIIPYIAISTIIAGFIFSIELQKKETVKSVLLRNNLLVLVLLIVLSCRSPFLFYNSNKIEQPKIDKKYLSYKSLKESITSENYKVELLLPDNKYQYVSAPYFLKNSSELIINILRGSTTNDGNKPPEIRMSYKIDAEGVIISKLSSSELESADVFPIVFDEGYLRDYRSTIVSTWTFDGNREKLKYKELKKNKNWKIEMLSKDSISIKEVAFFKKSKFYCNNINDVQYNGTKYYDIKIEKENLNFKIDSVYSHIYDRDNCEEKRIIYYKCKGMNFSLLCYDNKEYYIIKYLKK
jgi:hypothetical protein